MRTKGRKVRATSIVSNATPMSFWAMISATGGAAIKMGRINCRSPALIAGGLRWKWRAITSTSVIFANSEG